MYVWGETGGCCSPVLFSLFINELALEVIQNGRHGASFINDYFELLILLLADDVVLLLETVIGLQTQFNSLQRASSSLHLKVNMSKRNIVVFLERVVAWVQGKDGRVTVLYCQL